MSETLTCPARTRWIVAPTLAAGELVRAAIGTPDLWAIVTPHSWRVTHRLAAAAVTEYVVAPWPDDEPLDSFRALDDITTALESRIPEENR